MVNQFLPSFVIRSLVGNRLVHMLLTKKTAILKKICVVQINPTELKAKQIQHCLAIQA